MSEKVVVDANRLFSELISGRQRLRGMVQNHPEIELFCPEYVFIELFKHKEDIVRATTLPEPDMLSLLHSLMQHIRFFDEDAVSIGAGQRRGVCAGMWMKTTRRTSRSRLS